LISFKVNGRLGNQLFQLAAAYALAKKHKSIILPDERSGRFTVEEYFETNINYPLSWKLIHLLISMIPLRLRFRVSRTLLKIYYSFYKFKQHSAKDKMKIDPDFHQLNDNTCVDGYFQSEYYFENIKPEIKQIFKFKDNFQNQWKQWYSKLPNHQLLVAVHIRLGDYRNQAGWNLGANDLTLPESYYTKLVERHNQPGTLFIVMSDEPDTVRSWLPNTPNFIYSQESAVLDMISLTKAHVCILSHSSFSWWGAYLNTKSNAIIYAPKYFLGFRINRMVPENIIPENWTQVEIQHGN
jgi:hypothetical protein